MSKPNKPRVVKVDEHIKKSTKQSVPSKIPGKRGRPRKDTGNVTQGGTEPIQLPHSSQSIPSPDRKPSSTQHAPSQVAIVPQYDTTEEAKGIISAPFSAAASLTGVPQLALTEFELLAIMPSWKVVYDKRIAPYLGQNADLYAFSFTMVNVVFAKFRVYQAAKPKAAPSYHVEPVTVPAGMEIKEVKVSTQENKVPAGASFSPNSFPGIPVELVK